MPLLNMNVNGTDCAVEVEPHEYLAYVLRERLGLTGTKIGCDEAECGACTVLVDGIAVDSCIYPAVKARGARVETIEGLAQGGKLHPLQRAFVEHGAVQCGFCTPGLIMAAKGLLDRNPHPTDDDIKTALKDNYCRCTGYVSVIRAIQAAVESSRVPGSKVSGSSESETLESTNLEPVTGNLELPRTKPPLSAVGRSLPRIDAVAKVTGATKYADDYVFPGMLYGATLRAKYPHARILSIDPARARALAGVHAVLTHADVPGSKNHGLIFNDWPVLCYDKVRYAGDAVAIVAAETKELAQRALDLIDVEYEELPVVDNPIDAQKPDAPLVNDIGHGNLLKHIKVDKGDVEQGLAQADVIVEREYHTPTYEHAFLEPECAIGRMTNDGRIEVYVGSQIPYEDRRQIAASLDVPESQVRVIGTVIGGGFGGKEDIAGQIHVALLSRATGRPVKMLYSRHESLIFHPKRHATIIRIKTGAKRDGTLTAVRAEIFGDSGAYASLGDKVMTRAATHAAGPYAVPNVKIDCYAMYTNNPPSGAFRGFGVTQSAFAVESNMDILARELGMDPVELRRKNALRVGATTSTGQLVRESVGLLQCIDKVEPYILKSKIQNPKSKITAWGFAAAFKNTGLGGGADDKSAAEVEVFADGTAEVRSSAAEIGQGLPNVLAQITAEELGLPVDRVRILLSDTDLTPDGGPTTASRQTVVTGNAARLASKGMREALAKAASERLDAPPEQIVFRDGLVAADGRRVRFEEVVSWALAEGRATRYKHEYVAPETRDLGQGGDMHFAFSYAAQAALVEVDTNTGEVHVLKVVTATDVGRAINPLALQGQIEGGIVMCIGNALTEEYIVEKGKVWTDRLAKYKMPGIKHTPEIVSFIVEDESSVGPYGAKGVGEISSIPTTPAIVNAIHNAVGVRIYSLPVDQDKLLRAMRSGAKEIH